MDKRIEAIAEILADKLIEEIRQRVDVSSQIRNRIKQNEKVIFE